MSNSSEKRKKYGVPIWCKPNLSVEEVSLYTSVGIAKIYEMTD